jgi:hypothetical protein
MRVIEEIAESRQSRPHMPGLCRGDAPEGQMRHVPPGLSRFAPAV